MASYIPNTFHGRQLGDTAQVGTAINLATDTIKLMLLTSSHTPNIDTEVFIDDVSASEVGDSGSYSAGGVTLTVTGSTDDTNDWGKWDATDVQITTFTGSFRYGVIYKDTGTPSSSPIICVQDYGATSATNGTVDITFHANGIITQATA